MRGDEALHQVDAAGGQQHIDLLRLGDHGMHDFIHHSSPHAGMHGLTQHAASTLSLS